MKALLASVLVMGMFSSALGFARPPAASPLIGVWSVDVSRLPMAAAARPRSVTFRFADGDSGKWTIDVNIVDANGKERNSTITAPLDGTASPVQGDNSEANVAAIKMPQPDVMILVLSKDGLPGSTRVYAVAAGGRSMIETAVYFGKDGVPITRTNYLTRGR